MTEKLDEEYLSVTQTARLLNTSDRAIWRLVSDGRLPHIRPPGLRVVRIPRAAIAAWLHAGTGSKAEVPA